LLITAEREALQTLRNELVQRFPKNSRALKEKLKEVDRRLKEIENENHG
jgi:ABC-type Zn uptake system ZnuABC Zn-binding protein ZnuA